MSRLASGRWRNRATHSPCHKPKQFGGGHLHGGRIDKLFLRANSGRRSRTTDSWPAQRQTTVHRTVNWCHTGCDSPIRRVELTPVNQWGGRGWRPRRGRLFPAKWFRRRFVPVSIPLRAYHQLMANRRRGQEMRMQTPPAGFASDRSITKLTADSRGRNPPEWVFVSPANGLCTVTRCSFTHLEKKVGKMFITNELFRWRRIFQSQAEWKCGLPAHEVLVSGAKQLFKWIEAALRAQVDFDLRLAKRLQPQEAQPFLPFVPADDSGLVGAGQLAPLYSDDCNSFLLLVHNQTHYQHHPCVRPPEFFARWQLIRWPRPLRHAPSQYRRLANWIGRPTDASLHLLISVRQVERMCRLIKVEIDDCSISFWWSLQQKQRVLCHDDIDDGRHLLRTRATLSAADWPRKNEHKGPRLNEHSST